MALGEGQTAPSKPLAAAFVLCVNFSISSLAQCRSQNKATDISGRMPHLFEAKTLSNPLTKRQSKALWDWPRHCLMKFPT